MNSPILIYVSKQSCGACNAFNDEWKKIKEELAGKVRFVRFKTTDTKDERLPPCINEQVRWFPTVLLVPPRVYFRAYTIDDDINEVDYRDDYKFKVYHYDSVNLENGNFTRAGSSYDHESVIGWFEQVVGQLYKINEDTPPSKYPDLL